jgi:signal transduction histidine kinase/CheY-like chemotaxis protein/PAS domain-containing protein
MLQSPYRLVVAGACEVRIVITGGSGRSVDIAAISGMPGFLVILVDEDQKIVSWNEAAADLFGVPTAQALGQSLAEVGGPLRTVTGRGRESLAPVIAAAGWWSGSLLFQREDCSEFLLQATGLRVPLEHGSGTLWLSHLHGQDSDQRALREALALAAAEHRRLTMIAEAGQLFGSSLDLDVVLDLVATKTAQALGDCCQIRLLDESGEFLLPTATHHNDALRTQAFQDSVYGRPASVSGSLSGRALRSGEAILMARFDPAYSGLTDDRGFIAARAELRGLIIAPLITAGTALGVLVVLRDVTEEPYDETDLALCVDLAERAAQGIYNARLMGDVVRADAERAAAQDRLRHAERMESLGQLVGGIAHDFNNLLNVIASFSDMLAEEIAALAAEDARLGTVLGDVEQVRRAAQRAIRLTRQLLIFARSDVVHPEVLSLNEIVAGLEQLLSRTLGEHITLTVAPASDLWPVKADAGQLEQVLVNLAVNARDAMPGGGKLTIDTANVTVDEAYAEGRPGLKPGRYIRLRVSDTGTGIPPEVLARVFEPFFTTKPTGQGTGLGLATFYGIITGAGGHVQIYSEPGLGTTVTGLLPATSEEAVSSEAPPAAPPRGHGETILLVEDETSLQELASRLLARNGYQVRVALTASEAPSIAADTGQAIDLLLTDVVMPEMLGNEVARRVHAVRPALPVLYMSGYAQPILDTHGAFANQIDLLEKPFTEATLLTRVRRAIDNGTHPATLAGKT